ncbi:MAG: PIG-L deacetylase family protein [Draconibacterium sp.]
MSSIERFKNVLVLAPHTDDGELGAGGTISKLTRGGVNVYYAAFSTAEESVPKGLPKDILKTEVKAATKVLGIDEKNLRIYNYKVRKLSYVRQDILEDLVALKKELDPDLVLMPSLNDIHQDHTTVAKEGVRAFKDRTVLGYELIWNNLSFNTTSFVKLGEIDVQRKFEALQNYKSQSHRRYVSKEFVYALATTRGVQIGTEYAEAFEVIRWVL